MSFIKKNKMAIILSPLLAILIIFLLLPQKLGIKPSSFNQNLYPNNTNNISTLDLGHLTIKNSIGDSINFEIEIADTIAKKTRGLMFRKELPRNRGMLFIFKSPQIINMWMFNTKISLDMIFIDENNKIVKIAQNTKIMSSTIISSEQKSLSVLEINAGLTKKFKIEVGDQIQFN